MHPRSELFDIGLGRIGPDGRIYVAENSHKDIRVFDASGKFIANIGRGGAGPGEFREVGWFGWVGDTLWVTDRVLRRISLFNSAYQPITSFSTDVAGSLARPVMETLTPNGRIAQLASGDRTSALPAPVVRVSRDGKLLDTIVKIDYGRSLARTTPEMSSKGQTHVLAQAFLDLPVWDVDRTGRWLAVAYRAAPTSAAPTRAEVRVFDLRTGAERTIGLSYTPVPTTKSVLDSVFKRYSPDIRTSALQTVLYLPQFLPPISSIVVGDNGNVWLERRGEVAGTWVRLDAQGAVMDVVRIPLAYRVVDARANDLLALIREPDDVQPPVVVYSIVK